MCRHYTVVCMLKYAYFLAGHKGHALHAGDFLAEKNTEVIFTYYFIILTFLLYYSFITLLFISVLPAIKHPFI